jgi:cytochrome c oxidase subunit IV
VGKENNQAIGQKPESAIKHILSFIIMIAFTAAAFFVVVSDAVPDNWVVPLLLIFAVIQVFLQLFTFMHLDQKGTAFYTFFMIAGIFIAVISALGILLM